MLQVGDRIERYEVEAFIGEGGLARVYRVRHQRLGSQYALKMLAFRGKRLANRLLREGQIQARLKHPNVVTVLDVIDHEGRAGLLMEFVEGESLEQALNRGGAMTVDESLRLFGQVLAGVSAAHDAGVLHRDLKPGNILLQPASNGIVAKVTDFGIARLLSTEAQGGDTLQSDVIGTPGYMAPEQASDPTSVDVRADLFSMGALLYGMVTGAPPFRPGTLAQMLSDVEDGKFTPVIGRLATCPPHLAAAIERCLSPNPDDRFDDCKALAAALYGAESEELASLNRGPAQSWDTGVGAATAAAVSGPTAVPAPTGDPDGPSFPDAASDAPPSVLPATVDAPAQPSLRGSILGGGAVGLVVLLVLVGLWGWWTSTHSVQPALTVDEPPAMVVPSVGERPASPTGQPDTPVVAAPDDAPSVAPPQAGPAVAPVTNPEPSSQDLTSAPVPAAAATPDVVPTDSEPSTAEPVDEVADAADESAGTDDAVAMVEPSTQEPVVDVPSSPPEAAAPPPSAALDVMGTWEGRLGGRASTLRVVEQNGERVRAKLEVLLGTSYRTFSLSGSLVGNHLKLRGVEPDDWSLDARLSDGMLDGSLTAPGRRKGTTWRATR